MIKALIFDFDGLILDTEGPIFQSWQEAYRQHGFELPLEKWAAVIGTYEEPFEPLVYLQELAGGLSPEPLRSQQKAREAELIAQETLRPGVLDYLLEARRIGLKLAIASSSPCLWVTGHLERLGVLGYFDCLRCKDHVRVTKPDPELYLSAAACLGIAPQQAIALEDSPNGITAARRAGMFCLVAPNPLTRQLPLEHASLRVDSLADLPLEKLLQTANEAPRRIPFG